MGMALDHRSEQRAWSYTAVRDLLMPVMWGFSEAAIHEAVLIYMDGECDMKMRIARVRAFMAEETRKIQAIRADIPAEAI